MTLLSGDDPLVRAAVSGGEVPSVERIFRSREMKLKGSGLVYQISDRQSESLYWKDRLAMTRDGAGLDGFEKVPASGWMEPIPQIKGREFIRAIHVRLKTLNTPSRAIVRQANGVDPSWANCGSCGLRADLNHISQVCGLTGGLRTHRHDRVVKALAFCFRKRKYQVWVEHRLAFHNTYCKPDLVVVKDRVAYVLDPAICTNGLDLAIRYDQKVAKYQQATVRDQVLALTGCTAVETHGICITYRGAIYERSYHVLRKLGIVKRSWNFILLKVLVDTWRIWNQWRSNSYSTRTRRR